jgi:cytochrome P450
MASNDSDTTEKEHATCPPGPDGLPLVGSLTDFFQDQLGFYEYCAEEYGDMVQVDVAGETFYHVTHPDYIEKILVKDDAKYVKGDFQQEALAGVTGDGLFLSEGEQWERQRKIIQPAFFHERVDEEYTQMMTEYAESMIDDWDDGQELSLHDEMRALTLQILAKTLTGQDIRGKQTAIGDAGHAITSKFGGSKSSVFLPDWIPTPTNVRYKRTLEQFSEVIDGMIAERKSDDTDRIDLLSILLDAEADDGSQMSDKTVRDQIFSFLLAGHETTALTLTYSWYLLSQNPKKCEKLVTELDEVLGGRTPTMQDLDELGYPDKVVKEAMRLYPPVYNFFREPAEDVKIGGYHVPEGATLSLPQWVVHRDERWYDDPETFRPERWAEELEDERPDYSYFPFGGGSRHCIGMRFARIEAQLVLATVAQQYRLELTEEDPLELVAAINIQPRDEIPVRVEKR